MEQEMISVLVAIYRGESYLDKCVTSILNQTYSNIEIILVDDGSDDTCPKICDEYQKMDTRVKVVHKENGGLADARNAGIKAATSDLIMFVDGDDSLTEDAVQCLYDVMTRNNVPVVYGDYIRVNSKGEFCEKQRTGEEKKLSGADMLGKSGRWSVWAALYRRSAFEHFAFQKGLTFEDFLFTPQILLNASYVATVDKGIYYYLIREDSIMGTYKKNIHTDLLDTLNYHLLSLKEYPLEHEQRKKIIGRMVCSVTKQVQEKLRCAGAKQTTQFRNTLKAIIRKNWVDIFINNYIEKKHRIWLLHWLIFG